MAFKVRYVDKHIAISVIFTWGCSSVKSKEMKSKTEHLMLL